jgi:hypothetical protein
LLLFEIFINWLEKANLLLRLKLSFILFFLASLAISGQHCPLVDNFNAQYYGAHNQNWSLAQSPDRTLYAGNTYGLLAYNANYWRLHTLKVNKIVRSVCSYKNRLYTGSFGEIGYWEKSECKGLNYYDLTNLIPENLIRNEEIWNIVAEDSLIWFQSFSVLLAFNGQRFIQVRLPGSFMFLQLANDRRFIQVLGHGIYEITDDLKPIPLKGTEFFRDKTIAGILPISGDTFLLATNRSGLFLYASGKISSWNSRFQNQLAGMQINKALRTRNAECLIFGTIANGVLISDLQGNLKHHLNTGNGLQNNTVLSIMEDMDGNVWLGLDKGISKINFSSNISGFRDVGGIMGSVYTALQMDSVLYLGSNQGVYYRKLRTHDTGENKFAFKLIAGTQGQAWQLFNIGKNIYCGHNEGTFLIKNFQSSKISGITGGWYNDSIPGSRGRLMLQGNYTGLAIFSISDNTLTFSHKVEGYSLPVKKFIFKDSELWICGPNTSLKRLVLDSSFQKVKSAREYSYKEGLLNPGNIDITKFDGKILVFDGEFYYAYEPKTDNFIKSTFLEHFKPGFVLRTIQDDWFRIYGEYTIRMNNDSMVKHYNKAFNKDYNSIIKYDDNHYLYCLDDGYLIDEINVTPTQPIQSPDSIYFSVNYKDTACLEFDKTGSYLVPNYKNDISIWFWDYHFSTGKSYEYRLLPHDKDWKIALVNAPINFTNLNSGEYTIEIKRNDNALGRVSFKVLPPWHLSNFALFIYFAILIALIYRLYAYFDTRLIAERESSKKENERLQREHQTALDNQRLQNENIVKNKELANVTSQLIRKNETLQEIKEELITIRKSRNHTFTTKDFQNILKQINDNLTLHSDKKLFDASFDEVHESFFKQLKSRYPQLSKNDMKLAAFIKMDLSTKEIAPLFNISLRGLENRRYRLRKKLNLANEINLCNFFNTIT